MPDCPKLILADGSLDESAIIDERQNRALADCDSKFEWYFSRGWSRDRAEKIAKDYFPVAIKKADEETRRNAYRQQLEAIKPFLPTYEEVATKEEFARYEGMSERQNWLPINGDGNKLYQEMSWKLCAMRREFDERARKVAFKRLRASVLEAA